MLSLSDIQAAKRRIKGGIYYSPCPHSEPLSEAVGAQIFCKLDHLQRTGSFKERGARNALLLLDDERRRLGVVAASAGNHALGLAYHGKLLDIPLTVVMPQHAPLIKITTRQRLNANVILYLVPPSKALLSSSGATVESRFIWFCRLLAPGLSDTLFWCGSNPWTKAARGNWAAVFPVFLSLAASGQTVVIGCLWAPCW